MLLRFLLLVAIGWVGPKGLAAQACAEAPDLARVQLAYDQGQYAKAERRVDRFIRQTPTCAAGYYWRARCLEAFEDYPAAYEAYTTACELDKTNPTYWLARGDFKRLLGTLRLQSPTACGECGQQWLPNVDGAAPATAYFQSALADYQFGLRQQPRFPALHYALALTHRALGDEAQACTHAHEADALAYRSARTYLEQYCSKKE